MKTIFIIEGGRDPSGRTARAADAFAEGAASAGAVVEKVFLPELKLERCRQCESNGWGRCRTVGGCVIEDDLSGLTGRILAARAVVFANPVYYGDLSESLRAFLDRVRRTTFSEQGRDRYRGKPAAALCVSGGGGGGSPSCAVSIEKVLQTIGFDLLDVILARRQNLELKLEVCRLSGRWFAEQI